MKLGRLYLKIYLFFVLILFITEILIFGLFRVAVSGDDTGRFRQYITAQVFTVKELIENTAADHSGVNIGEIDELQETMEELGRLYSAKLWIQDEDGRVLASSFEGGVPHLTDEIRRKADGFDIYRRHKHTMPVALAIPVFLQETEASLYVYLGVPRFRRVQTIFLAGLLLIGAVTALLLLPLSRYISKPLERLRLSALKIADGDLKERAAVKSRDEIGDLVTSFNIMAQRVERMVVGTKQLTLNISHQLRSPLARIRVAWELLSEKMEGREEKNVSRYLGSIREEIEEMDRLIGRILMLTKLDMREAPEAKADIDITKIIGELEERYMPSIKRKNIVYDKDTPDTGFIVHAEREQLKEAFSNLYENAIKFTPPGGRIRLRVYREDERPVFSLANSCEPLKEDPERLFEPYYRGSEETVPGTGLGLAITKRIAENSGGSIEAVYADGEFVIRMVLPGRN